MFPKRPAHCGVTKSFAFDESLLPIHSRHVRSASRVATQLCCPFSQIADHPNQAGNRNPRGKWVAFI